MIVVVVREEAKVCRSHEDQAIQAYQPEFTSRTPAPRCWETAGSGR